MFAAAALLLLAIHRPLSGPCFGFVDDYVLLDAARPLPDWPFLGWLARDGRPLYGVLLNLVLAPLGDVCDLGFLRLLNVGLEALIAVQIFALAQRHDWPTAPAAALGILVVALPGFAVAASWATLVGPLAAIALGLAAAWFAMPAPGADHGSPARPAAAACLLAAALSLYQPGAMAYVAGVAVALVRQPATIATLRRAILPAAFVFAAVVLAYAIVFLVLPLALPGDTISARATLTPEPWHKAIWFLGVPLRQALNPFSLLPVPRFGLALLALVALGTFLRHRGVGAGLVALAAQAGLVVLAFLPNLAVAESWPAFRSSLPMAMTVAVLAAAAILAVAEALPGRAGPAAGALLLAATAAFGLHLGGRAADRGIVRLQREEWRIVVEAVRALRPPRPHEPPVAVTLVPAAGVPGCVRWQRFDEFGLPSTARPWAAHAMLRHAWRQVHGEAPMPRFVVAPPGAPP
ncbi:hypothetical protein, partial [Stella sp.]|uniref:hypothetical protein n=1 Tax=Stella sp. TaxID=2912054 RepID=UPI0035AD8E49